MHMMNCSVGIVSEQIIIRDHESIQWHDVQFLLLYYISINGIIIGIISERKGR